VTARARPTRTARPSWVGVAGITAWFLVGAWAPRAEADPVPTEPSADTRAAEAGVIASFQLTSLMLHLVAGVPAKGPSGAVLPRSERGPTTLLELEARVWAGEEGLPPPAEQP
jgi:hypothetical protein